MKEIKLSRGKIAVVDDTDYQAVSARKWYALLDPKNGRWYAKAEGPRKNGKRTSIHMHREIMQAPDEVLVDHKDGNGINNQRDNLRLCSRSQNMFNRVKNSNNTSGFKGVEKLGNKWRCRIRFDKVSFHIGMFGSLETAARAYDDAALILFGDFSAVNFPDGRAEV